MFKKSEVEKRVYYVYFIQGIKTSLVKIGITSNIDKRIRALQIGSPDKLKLVGLFKINLPGTRSLSEARRAENVLHRVLSEYREHGEWFSPSPKVLGNVDNERFMFSFGGEKCLNE